MMVGICAPLYCVCLFAFLRIGYDKRFYPIVAELDRAKWVRVVWWLLGAMLLEVLMLIVFKLHHRLTEGLEFHPFTHGQRIVRQMGTTLGPICATGYLVTTLAICTHRFHPV
jgi:hypothetical protein